MATHRLAPLGVPENPPFGHQDPAWRPDGTQLLYVRNGRDGSRGAPAIWRYDPATKKTTRFSQAGYSQPAFSPDGRYLAATKISTLGTDVVVLDARTANELLRVTIDGRSWGAAWSPDGTQIAFLHLAGLDHGSRGRDHRPRRECRPVGRHHQAADGVQRPRPREPAGVVGAARRPRRRRRRAPRRPRPARRRDRAVPRPPRPPNGARSEPSCASASIRPRSCVPAGWPDGPRAASNASPGSSSRPPAP